MGIIANSIYLLCFAGGAICIASGRADGIERFLTLNDDNMENVLQENQLLLVVFHGADCSTCAALGHHLSEAAADLAVRLARLDVTAAPLSARRHPSAALPSVRLLGTDADTEYRGALSAAGLAGWLRRAVSSTPPLLRLDEGSYDEVFGRAATTSLLLFMRHDGLAAERSELMRRLARQYRGQVRFVWVDVDGEGFARILEWFGVAAETVPALRLLGARDTTKYRPQAGDGTFTEDAVRHFLAEFFARRLKRFLRSEELPADWDARPVRVLVGSNFDQVAFDKSRDVLVDLYAPWCGHCKKLEPVLDQLGEKYKNSKSVLIAKMDATKNELSHTAPRSFPSIMMWKRVTNEVVEYNGERTAHGISRFIESDGQYGRAAPDDDQLNDEHQFEYEEADDDQFGEDEGDDFDAPGAHTEL